MIHGLQQFEARLDVDRKGIGVELDISNFPEGRESKIDKHGFL